ncbi:hypothetical protein PO124_33315 [Bacillus licheniformis]|nr:hypothetical protein [Bacillus licheniformis]
MDSMFRESGLFREKWDRQHSSDGATYGEMTIAAAVYSTHTTISDLLEEQQEQPYEIYISHPEILKLRIPKRSLTLRRRFI